MLTIGLTGGIGSGKTTVANLFAEKGITVIDTDQLARDLTQPGTTALKKITERFGKSILQSDSTLDRAKLRKTIFENPDHRIWLEQLLHPAIRQEVNRQIASAQSPYCLVVIPLLFETAPNPAIHRTLVIDAPIDQQISRTMTRDATSAEAVNTIIKTQISREKRLALADDIIDNNGTLENLKHKVNQLHVFYLDKAKNYQDLLTK